MSKKSMIEKAVSLGWQDDGPESCEDGVIQACQTYGDMGQLLAELLEWNSGSGDFDDRAVALLAEMLGEYVDNVGPQPER